uniref:Peptidase S9 prolyl oligopeptidase catalytic domain-containing protein n=1 Tax=uncultured Armatimonadetes bacterium TaxID=157466 RepID=A0A6J4JTF4_9BACT|nr:FIG00619832: hypothetical protein [uncultured Armatimonadetes bacterium]
MTLRRFPRRSDNAVETSREVLLNTRLRTAPTFLFYCLATAGALCLLPAGAAVPAGPAAAPPPPAAPASSIASEITLRDGLVVGNAGQGGGRRLFGADAVQALLVRGEWRPPKRGDALRLPDGGQPRAWEPIRADDAGVFQSRALAGGYLYAAVDSADARVALLEARGNTMAYVNGEPRAGDPYDHGYFRVPVKLRAGRNDFLFACGRGRLRARLLPVAGPVTVYRDDATLPDLLTEYRGGSPLWGAVVVANASEAPLVGLRLEAAVASGGEGGASAAAEAPPPRRLETVVPVIPPLSVRKVPFRIGPTSGLAPGNARLVLTLRGPGRASAMANADLALRVRRPKETHRRTFVSGIDGSVQYYAVTPAQAPSPENALVLSLHGASVEALGQAEAYGAKDWATLVAPTNRRPYGFDWEDWGRLDALEVLHHAQQSFPHDSGRVSLTGHSMGGHGAWSIGSLFPSRFAAVGPSAGWISFATYGGGGRGADTAPEVGVDALLARGANPSDTLLRAGNLLLTPVYILHGDADDNVPVEQARRMRARLTELHHPDLHWHEERGAGHWWDVGPAPGADCVDWGPMFALFGRSRIPARGPVRLAFTTPDPGVSASCYWLRIDQQEKMLLASSARLAWDATGAAVRGETQNVQRLTIYRSLLPVGTPLRRIEIDGQALTPPPPSPSRHNPVYLAKVAGRWRVTERPAPPDEKNPARGGTFKQAFANRFVLVYGTKGTPDENAWAYARARFDAETFLYRGNGAPDVLPDTEYEARRMRDRSVILYGHADMNSAWKGLLGDSPVQVRRSEVRLDGTVRTGDGLAAVFVRPKAGTSRALVGAVCGTGMPGLRLTDRLPVFVSGTVFPDWLVADTSVLDGSSRGVLGAGYFGNDWSTKTGEAAWRDAVP